MLDIHKIRKNREKIEELLKRKDPQISLNILTALDEQIRSLKQDGEALKNERNAISQKIALSKRQKATDDAEMETLVSDSRLIGEKIKIFDEELINLEKLFLEELASLPNTPFEDIPISLDPKDNVCIKEVSSKREFNFPFKNHLELGESLGLFDFQKGAQITGSGWPVYKALGAELESALLNYMLDIQKSRGFMQMWVPFVVRRETMFASGQLPKFEEQLFKIPFNGTDFFLIPTSEVSLNGLHLEEIFEEDALPKLYTSYSPCFRKEAGAAGKGERGLIRNHQFNKVELFAFTKPEESNAIFEKMVESANIVLDGLELHYRNMLLVTGDMSFASSKTVDVEVYLPGQERYYEVSSISNCTDYQARRSQTRFRNSEGKLENVHTLNGSGVATSRLMVALLENHQQEDGSIYIPKALRPYFGNRERLG